MSQALPQPASCCTPCDETINVAVPGPQGEPGTDGTNGTDGANAYTLLLSAFEQPAVDATAIAEVASSAWAVVGEDVFLEGGGYYLVTAIPDSTHVTLQNRGYTANSAPGTIIAVDSKLSPSGEKGESGAVGGGDLLAANNLSDVANSTTSRTNLGLGALAVLNTVNDGNWSGTDLAVANGGTGSSTAAGARTNLGLGALAVLNTVNNGEWSGTDLAVINGGTGASTAALARTNLGTIAADYALFQHQQVLGTDGGTFTSGAWRVVPLTTEVADANSIGTLASNEVTLIAGTYRFRGWASAYNVDSVQARLYNVTTTSVISYGRCAVSSGASTQFLYVEGRFTVAGVTVVRMEAQCSTTKATDGFGKALSFGTEIYAGLEFIKE